ncbi:MAG TPA: hypothetical protein VKX96_15850, partial [Chloroflexota bacterium]|nr:hypothetical protein [Chloroflexota bacterium]
APVIESHARLWFVWAGVVLLFFGVPSYLQYRKEKRLATVDTASLSSSEGEAPVPETIPSR